MDRSSVDQTRAGMMVIMLLSLSFPAWADIPFNSVILDSNGPKDPWAEHVIVERIECVIHGLATADFNGDGAVDIAASEMHQGDDPDEVAVFVNRGKGAAWDKQVLSTKGSHCIQAGDIGSDSDIDLMGANWSGPYQPIELWENRSGGGAWWNSSYGYRLAVQVNANGFERQEKPVEVAVNLAQLLQSPGRTETKGELSVRVVEIDASSRAIGEVTPVQFDGNVERNTGTLTFTLTGVMLPNATRTFHAYFGFGVGSSAGDGTNPLVRAADDVDHEGQLSFRITTRNAVYYYHKQGAGFASMEDRDGNDWLSYNPGNGPASKSGSGGKYRGLPNMVHPEGCFHPGNDKSRSRLLSNGPVKATIMSESEDGKWACQWDIFPSYARQTVLKADHAYWFLYEGTPGGKLDEDSDYCVRCDGTRTAASARWDGDIVAKGETGEWLYFGDGHMSRVLYLIHEEDDDEIDSYWPMNHEMTVFGFGRKNLEKYMKLVPTHFTVGFCDKADFATVSRAVQSAHRPLAVTVGRPQAREQ